MDLNVKVSLETDTQVIQILSDIKDALQTIARSMPRFDIESEQAILQALDKAVTELDNTATQVQSSIH